MSGMLRIVFMGTPDFAIPTFQMLIDQYEVVLAVTKPDKPKGRGGAIAMPPVKELALKHNIPVYQPENAKTPEFYETLKAANADLFVTCAYGKILTAEVLTLPKYGCINVHASILPAYRGAAPLWHAVIDGQAESGITTMMTDVGMDTGDILRIDRTPIPEDMTMGELHDALSELGPKTLKATLDALEAGTLTRTPQAHELATYAPMVERESGHIDWTKPARQIHNLVRGTNPFPAAYTNTVTGARVKIWKTRVLQESGNHGTPGTVTLGKGQAFVACGEGLLELLEVQGENARKMTIGEYLNGHTLDQFK